ncbi:hepatitis A virus cellular receptor 1 homolog, partial [Nannospalax galili]|uniref:hepatitis A virus cellular receptor 1 homolog n=1 Tax=Nannospalax galili TaxID=1026970 RepID=UPI00111C32A1
MMHPGVVISGLMLLLTAAVDSYTEVLGVVGQPVTLPCTYMASNGTLITCWGRGDCSSSCSDLVIWMDGHRVYYQKDSRYQLKGQISQGNVSLTIGRVLQSDSGSYCCRVQTPRWISIQVLTFLLKVRPETSTSPLAIPTMTMRPTTITKPTTAARPTTISKPATTSTRATQAPMSTRVSTSTPPILVHTQTPKPVAWNGTVTRSSDEPWNHHTEAIPTQKPWLTTTKEFIIGISITVLVLLILVSAVAVA